MIKYVFITGGVVSSLGKGISAASIGVLLQEIGYSVKIKKLDPYLNIDPGTMNPNQHGEVFVTDDGYETDLDLGHYERFLGKYTCGNDSITSGKIYSQLLKKERKGDYLGNTVQVIPHITDLIKNFVSSNIQKAQIVICEIGGTVGDIEGQPFFEAIRQMIYELGKENVLTIHLTLLPYIKTAKEIKTKPTQHSVKEIRAVGIQPDILICRSEILVDEHTKNKIATLCNVNIEDVIIARDTGNIYKVPLMFSEEKIHDRIIKHLKLQNCKKNHKLNLEKWIKLKEKIQQQKKYKVNLALIVKYDNYRESYKSLIEALEHSALKLNTQLNIKTYQAEELEKKDDMQNLMQNIQAVVVPGGFGVRGIKGKIKMIQFARTHNIPILGICLGMQLMVLEFAHNVLGWKNAVSTEFESNVDNKNIVVAKLEEWSDSKGNITLKQEEMGGTMRLGKYVLNIKENTLLNHIYKKNSSFERHRHRYEVVFDKKYKNIYLEAGMNCSGYSSNDNIVEVVELTQHKFFLGVQFHPEYKSTPFDTHPILDELITKSLEN